MRNILKTFVNVLLLLWVLNISIYVQAAEKWREHDYDVLHYKIEVGFEHDLGKVIGRTTITLTPKRHYFKTFKLDAHKFENVTINMITDVKIDHITTDSAITVILPREYDRGEKIQIIINYSCCPEKGLYFFSPDTDHPNRPKQIWTQGEGQENHHWFPCYDYPNDRATFEVIATVDSGLTCISNGKLVKRTNIKNKTKFHYQFDKTAVAYLISMVIGEYQKFEQYYKDIPVQYFVYPHHSEEDALRSFGRTPKMLQFFSDYIGYEYPYSKYAQSIITGFMYGGMENITATTQTDRTMHTEQAHLDHSSDGLVAHELAHQWWGDLITCRSWDDIWLNEGFATYFDYLFTEYYDGFDEFSYKLYTKEKEVIKRENNTPQYLSKGKSAYIKGASVLYMLRNYIGEESFRAAVNLYAHRFAYQTVETHDFRKTAEEVSGISLIDFFDQWVFTGGILELTVSTTYDEDNEKLRIFIKQEQDSVAVRPVFNLKLFIGMEVNNSYSEHQIHVTKRQQEFYINAPDQPQMVIFDAGQVILKNCTFEKTVPEWMYQAENANRVVDRIYALEQLGELATAENSANIIELLFNRYKVESFYAVRLETIKAFHNISTIPENRKPDYYKLLSSFIKDETKSSVRVNLIKALATISSENNVKDFENLFYNDPSFDVRVAALNAMLDLNPGNAEKYINTALETDSWDEKIRSAALKRLDELNSENAIKIAKKYSKYAAHPKLRLAAVTFLGKLANKDNHEAINILIDVVKEGGEHNRYRPVSKAIRKLSDLKIEKAESPLNDIISKQGNRYMKKAAKTALENNR